MPETHHANNEICQRYATAFLELASESNSIEASAKDLQSLAKALSNSSDLSDTLSNPAYSKEQIAKAFDEIMEKAGMQELTCKFISLLIEKDRLNLLPFIISAFMQELANLRGEVHAEVTVANDLNSSEKGKLDNILKKIISNKLTIDTRTDESLVGGFIVRVGSKMIDVSTKTQLITLANSMKG